MLSEFENILEILQFSLNKSLKNDDKMIEESEANFFGNNSNHKFDVTEYAAA